MTRRAAAKRNTEAVNICETSIKMKILWKSNWPLPRGARDGLFLIANIFPGKRSVAPNAQNPKFEFLAGELKLQLFATFNAVLNCWGMIGWWTTSIIPKKFKTAPKVPSSNLGFWALRATDLFPGKKLAIKKSPSLAPLDISPSVSQFSQAPMFVPYLPGHIECIFSFIPCYNVPYLYL